MTYKQDVTERLYTFDCMDIDESIEIGAWNTNRYKYFHDIAEYLESFSKTYIHFNDLMQDKKGTYLLLPCQWGDYSGGTIDRANCKYLLDKYKESGKVWEVTGDFGSQGVVILASSYLEASEDDWDFVDDINYVLNEECLDDDLVQEIENEIIEAYIEEDLLDELQDLLLDLNIADLDRHNQEDHDKLREMLNELFERNGSWPEIQDATSAYISMKDIFPKTLR